jgi:NADH:ubiquinone oxidoreductase subunit H
MLLLIGIYSKSKYSILGAVRSRCQRVSFEVVFFFLLFCFLGIGKRLVVVVSFNFILFMLLPIFFLIIIAELNRPPFDFSEGERELVRGFNLEMGGCLFVLLFLREYGFLLFFSYMVSDLFFSGSLFFFYIVFLYLLRVRRSFPRYRYDKLMEFF